MTDIKVKKIIAQVLIIALIISSTVIPAAADEGEVKFLPVDADGKTYYLEIVENDNIWYVGADSLGNLAGCNVQYSELQDSVVFYRGERTTILYTAADNIYLKKDNKYYVPLQEASVNVGVQFNEKGESVQATILKTPKELKDELSYVFGYDTYRLGDMILEHRVGWAAAEALSRMYAIVPFVGSSSIIGAITGEEEINRYKDAFAAILANEGELAEFLQDTSDFNSSIKKSAEVIDTVKSLTEKDGFVCVFLEKNGVDSKILELFADTYSSYEDVSDPAEWFEAYADVEKAMNIGGFLDAVSFEVAAREAEEALATAMILAFAESENKPAGKAAKQIVYARYGNISPLDVYYGWTQDTLSNLFNNKLEECLTGNDPVVKLYAKLATTAVEYVTGADKKSEFTIFYSIYANIQNELASFYYTHKDEYLEENAMYLRAAGIMYLKAAIAAYENLEFDKSLEDTREYALSVFMEGLAVLMDYSKEECEPTYDNQRLIDGLNKGEIKIADKMVSDIESPLDALGRAFGEAVACWGNQYTSSGWHGGRIIEFDDGPTLLLDSSDYSVWEDPIRTNIKIAGWLATGGEHIVDQFYSDMTFNELQLASEEGLSLHFSVLDSHFITWVYTDKYSLTYEWLPDDYDDLTSMNSYEEAASRVFVSLIEERKKSTNLDIDKDYAAAYLEIIEDLGDTYGLCSEWGSYHYESASEDALKYADLIDFQKDGIPELLCLCTHPATENNKYNTVLLYQFADGEAKQILKTSAGNEFGHTGVSNPLFIGSDGIWLENSDYNYESISWYWIGDGYANETIFSAVDEDDSWPEDTRDRFYISVGFEEEIGADLYYGMTKEYHDSKAELDFRTLQCHSGYSYGDYVSCDYTICACYKVEETISELETILSN